MFKTLPIFFRCLDNVSVVDAEAIAALLLFLSEDFLLLKINKSSFNL